MPSSPLSRARSLIGATTLVCFASAVGSPAVAGAREASPDALVDEQKVEAKVEYEKGARLYGEHRFEEAVVAFLSADRLAPSPALSFNIARAYERLGETGGALRWYRDYLSRAPAAENAGEVDAKVRALDAALVERGLQQLTITSSPTGAAVTMDGRDVGVTPYTGEHALVEHVVTLTAPDLPEKRLTLTLAPEAPLVIDVDLSRVEPAPAPAPVANTADAAPEPSGEKRFGVAPYVVAGSGVAFLALSLGFELARRGQESKAEDARSQIEFAQHTDSMDELKTTSRIFLGLGSVALVTGGVLYFLNEPSESPSPVAFGCTPHGCAASARGTF